MPQQKNKVVDSSQFQARLHLSGLDIMKEFNISPGPDVGIFLGRASHFYDAEPCSRNELMKKLKINR